MVFFRVALTAALLSLVLQGFGLQGDFVNWIAVVSKTGLYGLCGIGSGCDLGCCAPESSWRCPNSHPWDLALVAAASIVCSGTSQGLLTTVGSAAVLGASRSLWARLSHPDYNISSALAVQVERQFAVGDWVEIAGELGRVENISWNSTYLYDDVDDRYVINSLIDQDKTINYSRPSASEYRLGVEIGMHWICRQERCLAVA